MKKIISFEKELEFKSMIGEVSAISLDHTLKFTSENSIEGEFIITGKYKLTEASILEEEFKYNLPVDILLNEKLELETSKIDIDDFYYEIESDSTVMCHIDVKIEGVEKIEEAKIEENEIKDKEVRNNEDQVININPANEIQEPIENNELRECDGEKEILEESYDIKTDLVKEDIKEEQKDENSEKKSVEEVGSLFSSFKESDESFSSYSVYIIRENETIQSLIEKYKTTKEELENYNDLSNITIGSKIIIPTANEQ